MVVPWGLKFESILVQTISWDHPAVKAEILPDPFGEDVLHGFKVYLTIIGTRNCLSLGGLKKKKKLNIGSNLFSLYMSSLSKSPGPRARFIFAFLMT
jgi:hypothetical protein